MADGPGAIEPCRLPAHVALGLNAIRWAIVVHAVTDVGLIAGGPVRRGHGLATHHEMVLLVRRALGPEPGAVLIHIADAGLRPTQGVFRHQDVERTIEGLSVTDLGGVARADRRAADDAPRLRREEAPAGRGDPVAGEAGGAAILRRRIAYGPCGPYHIGGAVVVDAVARLRLIAGSRTRTTHRG